MKKCDPSLIPNEVLFLEDWDKVREELDINHRAKILGLMSDSLLSKLSYEAYRSGEVSVQDHFDRAMKGRRYRGKNDSMDIDTIKNSIDLLVLVESYVGATRWKKGGLLKCPFPDHKDGTPSLSLHPDKGYFVCFGCGKKGSGIDFVMSMEGCSLSEAVKKLKSYI